MKQNGMMKGGGRRKPPVKGPPPGGWAHNAKPRPWRPHDVREFDVHNPRGLKHYEFTDREGDVWKCNFPRHEAAAAKAIVHYAKVLSVCDIERVLRQQGRGAFYPDKRTRQSSAIWVVQVRKIIRRYRRIIHTVNGNLRREWRRRSGFDDKRMTRLQSSMLAVAEHRRRLLQVSVDLEKFAGDADLVDQAKLKTAFA